MFTRLWAGFMTFCKIMVVCFILIGGTFAASVAWQEYQQRRPTDPADLCTGEKRSISCAKCGNPVGVIIIDLRQGNTILETAYNRPAAGGTIAKK